MYMRCKLYLATRIAVVCICANWVGFWQSNGRLSHQSLLAQEIGAENRQQQQTDQNLRTEIQENIDDPVVKELRAQHERNIKELREAAKAASDARIQFGLRTQAESEGFRQDYLDAIERGRRVQDRLYQSTLQMLDYDASLSMVYLAYLIHEDLFDRGRYDRVVELGRKLDNPVRNLFAQESTELNELSDSEKLNILRDLEKWKLRQGFAEYTRDNYVDAMQLFEDVILNRLYDWEKDTYFKPAMDGAKTFHDLWLTEIEIREKEKAKGDNPRVEFKTTKGSFVVELYEDNAPETVANFIHLVESGYYDGYEFYSVIPHNTIRTGLARGAEGIPWAIENEGARPDAREFFGYTLGMIKSSNLVNPTSEFFITFIASPEFRGGIEAKYNHTAFGRVVEGKDVVDQLNKTHYATVENKPPEPIEAVTLDKIISAKVIRKRDHEYMPKKLSPSELGIRNNNN
jgi:cyclophilin family peptidyl-prolyl cis-trans isomerase